VNETDLRVAALEMLVWELLALLPDDTRQMLDEVVRSEWPLDAPGTSIRDRILCFRNQVLRKHVGETIRLDALVAQLRLHPDND
jgi:hypothetical protein